MIFDPPWSPEMMSEDAKFALGSEPLYKAVFRSLIRPGHGIGAERYTASPAASSACSRDGKP